MPPSRGRILVVDDDPGVVDYLVEMLEEAGYPTQGETSPLRALQRLREHEVFDLVVSDVEMQELRGVDLLDRILAEHPSQLVLLITAFGSIDLAVQAVRAGACDFLTKPFQIEQLLLAVERALRERAMRKEIVRLRSTIAEATPGLLVARSTAMRRAVDLARRAARSDASVLLTGETGSGKQDVARFIHESGSRAGGPFVPVSCSGLPSALLETELFGGGRDGRPGLLAQAKGGTLFLDEVGELPVDLQPRLLQALELHSQPGQPKVDVRVIASSRVPLEEALRDQRFRPELYYHLNVVRIEIPPLRDRPEDLQGLVDLCLQRAQQRVGRAVQGISTEALRWMMRYPWPGNVRELTNLIERAVAMTDHDTVVLEDLAQVAQGSDDAQLLDRAAALVMSLEEVERAYIRKIMELSLGNKSVAARILGIDRRTLYRKLGESEAGLPAGE
ncbi:MAG: sigma-54-dependent Fis family transcriptional regulator [Deltaproteobacteria bacterium]|nr:sigma-54-dependent Fis family transcriptional regulator [Deltaproteobacteria bacterium]